MAKLITVYWRDIPAQVTAKAGRKTAKIQLPDRFQEAIDMAAMRAGKGSTDAYLEDWRREQTECDNNLEAAAQAAAEKLEQQFDLERLQLIVKNKGLLDDTDK
ncbi:hypothetical protein AB833_15250 [Chromatiales bacterium (ex Bugula neritina AB1)]|nr:hypothetical protein AB833_15250 [Chromatiales bacterium (ex Bugula neritina AB1)]